MGRKDIGNTHSGGGIKDNTTEVKRKSEDHRCQHIHWTDSEIALLESARILFIDFFFRFTLGF